MTPSEPPTDPGWGGPKGVLMGLVPYAHARQLRRSSDPLVTLRSLFLSFCLMIVLIVFVLAFMDLGRTSNAKLSEAAAILLTALAGIVALVATLLSSRLRNLDCTSAASLESSYRNRFFLQMAIAEAPALVGFVLSFVAGTPWPYVVALPFTALGFAWAAPTKSQLARDQARLTSSGCTHNLVAALRRIES